MARLVFAMNLSLDGYVDHEEAAPDPVLFQHWIDYAGRISGSLYGSRVYQLMRYWEVDDPAWSAAEHAFARAWRAQPVWVASQSLSSVGPGAELIAGDLGSFVRDLKDRVEGEIDVAGPTLAHSLGQMGLIDEYRLYFHPGVLGQGQPFFRGPLPRLRFNGMKQVSDSVVCLSYLPGQDA